jgi:hypothetical protein
VFAKGQGNQTKLRDKRIVSFLIEFTFGFRLWLSAGIRRAFGGHSEGNSFDIGL